MGQGHLRLVRRDQDPPLFPENIKGYGDWIRKFQGFLQDKPPAELSAADVKAYLTYLAVNCKVAASTQNLAFNVLLFLHRHILKKDFGDHKDVPRAKNRNISLLFFQERRSMLY